MKAGNRHARLACVLAAMLALAACGGGSSDGGSDNGNGTGDGTGSGGGNSPAAGNCEGSGSVIVSGTMTYAFVPAVHPAGMPPHLDFGNSEPRPIRGAMVRAVCPRDSATYASTTTDESGAYSLSVPENVDVAIRVSAAMQKSGSPSWNLAVVDNTRSQGVWTLEGESFDSAAADITLNLHAAHGWTGNSYGEPRAAAPFAIMDSVYTAMRKVLTADAEAHFPALQVNWSPSNRSCDSEEPKFPFPDGCIGTSFYANYGDAGRNIFVLGDASSDTDEYDNHVIVHEWGHYYEDAFARSDSIGGQHSTDSRLDARVAFGEGWGNAFSAIATDDPLYVDTFGTDRDGFSFDVEAHSDVAQPGWWNEASIQEIIFDLYDANSDAGDAISLAFGALHAVLTGNHRDSAAMTSLFSFIHFLKQAGDDDLLIEQLVAAHEISPINDEWGDGRTTDAGPSALPADNAFASPVHAVHDVAAGPVAVCGTNRFADDDLFDPAASHEYNRIGARRFLRFEVPESGNWQVTLDGTGHELGADADPDFYIYLRGDLLAAADADSGGTGIESTSVNLVTGHTYVIEVLDWSNVDNDPMTPPAGVEQVCHDLVFAKTG